MPGRILEIELGLCFLVMFGTATFADDEVIFDLSEALFRQDAAKRRTFGTGQYVETAPDALSSQRLRAPQAQQSRVSSQSESLQPGDAESRAPVPESAQSGYPQSDYPQPGYPESVDQQSRYPQAGFPQSSYPPSGYPSSGHPQPGYPQPGYPPSGYPQSGYPEFAHPGDGSPPSAYPVSEDPAFAPVPDAGGGLFDWRPQPPHFKRPSRTYSLFRSNTSYGWRYTERCAPTPWKPRGDGIPRRTSCYRMDYAPYELEHDSSKHGPAFYKRHELYPCVECPSHAYHLQRFYGPRN